MTKKKLPFFDYMPKQTWFVSNKEDDLRIVTLTSMRIAKIKDGERDLERLLPPAAVGWETSDLWSQSRITHILCYTDRINEPFLVQNCDNRILNRGYSSWRVVDDISPFVDYMRSRRDDLEKLIDDSDHARTHLPDAFARTILRLAFLNAEIARHCHHPMCKNDRERIEAERERPGSFTRHEVSHDVIASLMSWSVEINEQIRTHRLDRLAKFYKQFDSRKPGIKRNSKAEEYAEAVTKANAYHDAENEKHQTCLPRLRIIEKHSPVRSRSDNLFYIIDDDAPDSSLLFGRWGSYPSYDQALKRLTDNQDHHPRPVDPLPNS